MREDRGWERRGDEEERRKERGWRRKARREGKKVRREEIRAMKWTREW